MVNISARRQRVQYYPACLREKRLVSRGAILKYEIWKKDGRRFGGQALHVSGGEASVRELRV